MKNNNDWRWCLVSQDYLLQNWSWMQPLLLPPFISRVMNNNSRTWMIQRRKQVKKRELLLLRHLYIKWVSRLPFPVTVIIITRIIVIMACKCSISLSSQFWKHQFLHKAWTSLFMARQEIWTSSSKKILLLLCLDFVETHLLLLLLLHHRFPSIILIKCNHSIILIQQLPRN